MNEKTDHPPLSQPQSGHQPGVLVWDVATGNLVTELRGQHKFGVGVVKFSPNGKLIASVGFEHDQTLCLWDWTRNTTLPTARAILGSKVRALAFSEDGSFFVTVGNKHVKFWKSDTSSTANVSEPSSALLDDSGAQNSPNTVRPKFNSIEGKRYGVGYVIILLLFLTFFPQRDL